jgi:hypothetical protein
MKSSNNLPPFLELEAFRRSVNRKLWFGMGSLAAVAIAATTGGFLTLLRPIPVVMLDGRGRPVLFEDTITPRLQMEEARVEYFGQHFLRHFMGLNGAHREDDLATAWNLMTPDLRRVAMHDAKTQKPTTAGWMAPVRTEFEPLSMRVGRYDPEDTEAEIPVVAFGKLVPQDTPNEGAPSALNQPYFFVRLVLQRVPVTKVTLFGLLVAYAEPKYFESQEALEVFVLRSQDG